MMGIAAADVFSRSKYLDNYYFMSRNTKDRFTETFSRQCEHPVRGQRSWTIHDDRAINGLLTLC